MKKIHLLILTLAIFPQSAKAKDHAEESGSLSRHSISIQVGLNGTLQNSKSYGFQSIPPDMAYSYEFFDNNKINMTTSTFYDNIGVKIQDKNFSYRVGQRIDVAMEMKHLTPYITFGLGTIRYGHVYQSSPVYGFGILKKISRNMSLVNEINFQRVYYNHNSYDILNASIGVVYNF
jgi:hypothetical protein